LDSAEVLFAPYTLEYSYKRSTGPVVGRFFAGLKQRTIWGVRTASGRVLVPPYEYDPDSGAALDEWVRVANAGVVCSWAWMSEPRPGQPLDKPFAWALIKLDGADTSLLHAVDVAGPEHIESGMRVMVRWADERSGGMRDIACFVPEQASSEQNEPEREAEPGASIEALEPVAGVRSPMQLHYTVSAGRQLSNYLLGLAQKRILGSRCDGCSNVYVPPRAACPTCGVTIDNTTEVRDRGTVTTFCVIRIPFDNAAFAPPYVVAAILLDGADLPIFHLIRGVEPEAVRMGMRVAAIWADELAPTLESIRWFEPSSEPDAEFSSYAEHL